MKCPLFHFHPAALLFFSGFALFSISGVLQADPVDKLPDEPPQSQTAPAANAANGTAVTVPLANIPVAPTGLQADPATVVTKTLEDGLKPFKKLSLSIEKVKDPVLSSDKEILCWRLLFNRFYERETRAEELAKMNPEDAARVRKDRYDHIDILMIPSASPFRLDKALRLQGDQSEKLDPATKMLFFKEYGLLWRKLSHEYANFTLYLGNDDNFYYFASGNLSVLNWIKLALKLEGGYDRAEYLAAALNLQDQDNFSPRMAIRQLALIKDEGIPYIIRAINDSVAQEEIPYPHFITLMMINSELSRNALNQFSKSESEEILNALFSAVTQTGIYHKELLPVYQKMITTRKALGPGFNAAIQAGVEKELEPAMKDILKTPRSVSEYDRILTTLFVWKNPKTKTIHKEAITKIKEMAMRNGEIPGTMKVLSLDSTKDDKNLTELEAEDRKRLEPWENLIIDAPEKEISLLTGLSLAMFDTGEEQQISQNYILRVRKSGILILKKLPQDLVRNTLLTLRSSVVNKTEKAMLQEIYLNVFQAL